MAFMWKKDKTYKKGNPERIDLSFCVTGMPFYHSKWVTCSKINQNIDSVAFCNKQKETKVRYNERLKCHKQNPERRNNHQFFVSFFPSFCFQELFCPICN